MGNSGLIGWLVVAVVAPVTGVLGWKQVNTPALVAEARPAEAKAVATAPPKEEVARTPDPELLVRTVPPRALNIFEEVNRKSAIANLPHECLRGITSMNTRIVLTDAARTLLNLDEASVAARVEGRLRQAKMPLNSQGISASTAGVNFTIDAMWATKDVQVVISAELAVHRFVYMPVPGDQFLFSAAPVWRDKRFGFAGTNRISDQKREYLDTSLDILVNDYLKSNP